MPTFTSFDGASIAYYDWPGSDSRRPVVLLHGFIANSALNWVGPGVVDALTAAGRRVVAMDARGHGDSEGWHDPARYGEPAMVRDVVALLDLLAVPEVDLVGYSMGGVVALLTTATDHRVRRLIVGGIGSGVVEVGGLDSRVVPAAAVAAALSAEGDVDPTSQAGVFRMLADFVGGDRLALAAVISGEPAGSVPLADITVPTLVVVGEDDILAARPEVLAAAITNARLVVLPGDHLTVLSDPGFVPAISDFLAAA